MRAARRRAGRPVRRPRLAAASVAAAGRDRSARPGRCPGSRPDGRVFPWGRSRHDPRMGGMSDPGQSRLRLMHVHAHPDDESSKGAATTAKYVAEGVDVLVATCTGGERGSILNPAMDRPDILANIAEVRRQEMNRARELLGVTQDW